MAGRNEIKHIRTDAGRYLFDISSFTNRSTHEVCERKKICYARVSSRGQKSDLQNQIALLKTKYPDSEIISDYGSGLNFRRKGLQKIMDLAHKGELQEVVVTYKDRLCRFGFELFEYILETQSNAKIMVLCHNSTSKESELATDLLSIITVFSARMHGLRKYKKQIKEDESLFQEGIQTEIETDDRII
jgi:predicted site-specific integrase-resolvase